MLMLMMTEKSTTRVARRYQAWPFGHVGLGRRLPLLHFLVSFMT